MAKRKAKRRRYRRAKPYKRRRKSKKIPILPVAGAIAPMAIAIKNSGGIRGITSDPQKALFNIVYEYSGLSMDAGRWDSSVLLRNVGIWVGTAVGHKVANALGVNRALGKIPFIGKYLSI